MGSLTIWSVAALLSGIACVVLFVTSIVRKRFSDFYASLTLLVLTVICSTMAALTFAHRSYKHLRDLFTPRDGIAIYSALFGAPSGCVAVINAQDQLVPKLDEAIRLHVRSCPAEIRRITAKNSYAMEAMVLGPAVVAPDDPFSPALLGDTVVKLSTEIGPGRNWRTIYLKHDSTEAIIIDALD
jgi:hypothetical protein